MSQGARVAAAALLLLAAVPVFAQPQSATDSPPATGAIEGRVTDPGGQPIEGASIGLAGTGRGVTTSADGRYRLSGVRVGVAQVIIQAGGHKKQIRDVQVDAGLVTKHDAQLAEEVVVLP